MGFDLTKYNTLQAGATRIAISVRLAATNKLAASGTYTPATGDAKLSIDGGAQANTTNTPAWDDGTLYVTLTAAETTGKKLMLRLIDAEDVIFDEEIEIRTYGHASAYYPSDYEDAVRLGLTALPNADAGNEFGVVTVGTGLYQINLSGGAVRQVEDVSGSIGGDIAGKILGGGASDIEGIGAWARGNGGDALATGQDVDDAETAIIEAVNEAGGGGGGSGDTPVNHDTGGTDAIRLKTAGGAGISSVAIRAYLKPEFDADALTATLRGEAVTKDDGRWAQPLMLSEGLTYTLTFERVGYTFPSLEITV